MSDEEQQADGEIPANAKEVLPLIKEGGEAFSQEEVAALADTLSGLRADQRKAARNANADAIALHGAPRMLLVSGPGTGKSTLFIARLRHWLAAHPGLRIAVATFVRKLVRDLREDITTDTSITDEDKKRVEVMTLHRLARSIVEQAHGLEEMPLKPYCRIISALWEEMVWGDAVSLHPEHQLEDFPWPEMEDSLYDAEPRAEAPWPSLRETHLRVQQFYNALTFPELILLASQAVRERPELAANTFFIIDEFQDFNLAEEAFIRAITSEAPGLLLAGDDDQVLYDRLRRGHASIIRSYYQDAAFVNAMLPYCFRSSLHVCRAAEAFLAIDRPAEAIDKLYLPRDEDESAAPVVVAATTSPKAGVKFLEQFLHEHRDAIAARQKEIATGEAKDSYLLILTPAREANFLKSGGAQDRLHDLLSEYAAAAPRLGEDYWRVRDHYFASVYPSQNYGIRKLLAYEDVDQETIAALLARALEEGKDFAELDHEAIARCLERAERARTILETDQPPSALVVGLRDVLTISDPDGLEHDLERAPIGKRDDPDDESPELEQSDAVSAVQLTTIVGAKGLSADHVFVLGCDETNLARISRNAFFVALTRARTTLTLMACMGGGGATMLHDFVLAIPDAHSCALYVKTNEIIEVESIAALQRRLQKWAYAKKKQAEKRKAKRAS